MEDGDSDGDNHSDRDSDEFGNSELYALSKERGRTGWVRPSSFISLLSLNHNLAATDDI